MMLHRGWLLLVAATVHAAQAQTPAQTPPHSPPQTTAQAPAPRLGEIQALGNERFRIGRIVVDKRGRSFVVPGKVHALDKPLEYLATTPEGRKAYESLLTLDASGSEFNLACILIGLERDANVPLSRPLSRAGLVGQPVMLWLAWTDADGKRRQISAAEALLDAQALAKGERVEWAYTGSFTSIDGSQLAADVTGTLISFVKKDNSGVIEAASGLTVLPYGAVRGMAGLPPEGSTIELIVDAATAKK